MNDLIERLREGYIDPTVDEDLTEAADTIDELILRLSSTEESEKALLKRVVELEAALERKV